MHARASDFASLPLPRHGAQAAADLAAKHTALSGSGLPIEGVPAHASAISAGAVAVFRRFFARAALRSRRSRSSRLHSISVSIISVLAIAIQKYIYIEMMEA